MIFDLIGTLVDNWAYGQRAPERQDSLATMARCLGADPVEFRYVWDSTYQARMTGALTNLEVTLRHIAQQMALQPSTKRLAEAAEARMRYARREMEPRPDAVETLQWMRSRGIRVGLVSNCGADVAAIWHGSTLAPLVDAAVLSCQEGLVKPDPTILVLPCQRLGEEPGDCFYVADGEMGELAAATRLGMTGVLIRSSYDDPPGLRQPHVEPWDGPEIAWLSELCRLLD